MTCRLTRIAGLFLLALLASCGAGGLPPGGSAPPPEVSITISPVSVSLRIGEQKQFVATVLNTGNTAVTWSMDGGNQNGFVTADGLYTAPAAMPGSPNVSVRVISVADPTKFALGGVTLQPPTVWNAFPIRLNVTTKTAAAASNMPVTSGVPMTRGFLTVTSGLRIQDAVTSANIPAQFEITSRWGDGSIRWLLCDFIADVGAAGTKAYNLNSGGSGNAATGMTVINGASSVDVDTGPLKFSISKTGFRLFESIQIDRDNDSQVDDECLNLAALKGIVIRDGATEFTMDQIAPDSVTVEKTGPIRAVIKIEGRHRSSPAGADKLRYVVRIHAWDSMPYIKVVYSFKKMEFDGVATPDAATARAQLGSFATADSVDFDLPISFGSAPEVLLGGDPVNANLPVLAGAQNLRLLENYAGLYDATDAGNQAPDGSATLTNAWAIGNSSQISYVVSGAMIDSGDKAPGWMQLAAPGGLGDLRVTVAIRDFWQQYPKGLYCEGNGLMRMELWPTGTWKLEVFEGVMKTHEMMLSFERSASASAATGSLISRMISDPPFAVADPGYYAITRAFGRIGVTNASFLDTGTYPGYVVPVLDYLRQINDYMLDLMQDRNDGNGTAIGHEYGFWHWGDGKTSDPNPDGGWENNLWGVTRAAQQWFAASGSLDMLRFADVTARHFRDVDVLHSDAGMRFNYTEAGNPAVTAGKATQLGKTRYSPNNKQHHMGHYNAGAHHLDVLNGGFLAEHYLLHGDEGSLDVLKEIFLYLQGTWKRHFDAGNGGVDTTLTCAVPDIGNALFIAGAYEAANGINDGNAITMANYVLATARARQSNVTPNDPSGNGFADTTGSFKSWQAGHLVEGLVYCRWQLDDPTIEQNTLDAMNWLLGANASVYLGNLPTPLWGKFAESPGGTVDMGGTALMLGAGYAAAYRKSLLVNWVNAALNLLQEQTINILPASVGDSGIRHSTFGQYFRAGPALLATLQP